MIKNIRYIFSRCYRRLDEFSSGHEKQAVPSSRTARDPIPLVADSRIVLWGDAVLRQLQTINTRHNKKTMLRGMKGACNTSLLSFSFKKMDPPLSASGSQRRKRLAGLLLSSGPRRPSPPSFSAFTAVHALIRGLGLPAYKSRLSGALSADVITELGESQQPWDPDWFSTCGKRSMYYLGVNTI